MAAPDESGVSRVMVVFSRRSLKNMTCVATSLVRCERPDVIQFVFEIEQFAGHWFEQAKGPFVAAVLVGMMGGAEDGFVGHVGPLIDNIAQQVGHGTNCLGQWVAQVVRGWISWLLRVVPPGFGIPEFEAVSVGGLGVAIGYFVAAANETYVTAIVMFVDRVQPLVASVNKRLNEIVPAIPVFIENVKAPAASKWNIIGTKGSHFFADDAEHFVIPADAHQGRPNNVFV